MKYKFNLYVMFSLFLLATFRLSWASETSAIPNFDKTLQEAKNGNVDSEYSVGRMYLDGLVVHQSDEQALKWFEAAAKNGHPAAQYSLGWMYRNELGSQPSDTQQALAFKWLEVAAKGGIAKAQYQLGVMYANGISVPLDNFKAVQWLEMAANQGDAEALDRLGQMYAQGLGVHQDFIRAKELYWAACEKGFRYGCINFEKINEKKN